MIAVCRPILAVQIIFGDAISDKPVAQGKADIDCLAGLSGHFLMGMLYRLDQPCKGGRVLHSVTSRSIPMILFSTSARSASISANGLGGWYLKNSRLKLIS